MFYNGVFVFIFWILVNLRYCFFHDHIYCVLSWCTNCILAGTFIMAYLCIELRYDHSNVLCMRKNKSILLDKNIMKCWDQSAFWSKATRIGRKIIKKNENINSK